MSKKHYSDPYDKILSVKRFGVRNQRIRSLRKRKIYIWWWLLLINNNFTYFISRTKFICTVTSRNATCHIHTYIICHYNTSVRIIDLFSHIILYISVEIYNLKSTPYDRFSEKLFMAILFTLRVFARNLLRVNCRRNTFRISYLMSSLGLEPWLFV